jgi:uncharacterized protein YuzE
VKLTYDPRLNIGYLRFHEKTAAVETIQVSDALNVDIASDGTIYGIELLNTNKQLRGDDGGQLVVVNEAAGKTKNIPVGDLTVIDKMKASGVGREGGIEALHFFTEAKNVIFRSFRNDGPRKAPFSILRSRLAAALCGGGLAIN